MAGSGGRSQAGDEQADVVAAAGGDAEAVQQGVGQLGLVESPGVGGQGIGQVRQAVLDVLAAAFDEPVGVEDEGVARGVGAAGLGAGDVVGAGSQRRVGGLVQQVDAAAGMGQHGRQVADAAVGQVARVGVDQHAGGGGAQCSLDRPRVQALHLQHPARSGDRAETYGDDEVPDELATARATAARLREGVADERRQQRLLSEPDSPTAPEAATTAATPAPDAPSAPPKDTEHRADQGASPSAADAPDDSPDLHARQGRDPSAPAPAEPAVPEAQPPAEAPPDTSDGPPQGEPAMPPGMTPERRAELIEAMTLLAPAMFHAGAGDPARYAVEGIDSTLAPGDSPVTPEEWDWAESWARLHPELADGDRNGIAVFHDRRRERIQAVRKTRRDDAARISGRAHQAWKAGETDRALQLIGEGEHLYPDDPVWSRARAAIQREQDALDTRASDADESSAARKAPEAARPAPGTELKTAPPAADRPMPDGRGNGRAGRSHVHGHTARPCPRR